MNSDGVILREKPETDLLSAFADRVILKFAGAWPPGENEIAREFVTFVTSQNLLPYKPLSGSVSDSVSEYASMISPPNYAATTIPMQGSARLY